jgi:hypothetical protein
VVKPKKRKKMVPIGTWGILIKQRAKVKLCHPLYFLSGTLALLIEKNPQSS